ncbi:MAG TPA: molybdopterin-dependent oxidoreductase [Microthrixaceae bacterium]|nr:molybdopterin-dependent oxidoreductase [Microthrixaceae bacterium]
MSTIETPTFCRLCEVNCGLVATTTDGRLTSVRPDKGHPVTAGYACKKGLLAVDVQNDPDRLDRPQIRTADGFESVGWDRAIEVVAQRLRAIIDESGPSSVALYLGNPNAFNASAALASGMFLTMLGSDRLFSAATQDCSNKFAVSEILYGSAEIHPIPDVDRTDFLLLIGTNPRVSKGSFHSMGDPIAALKAAEARGAVIRFVNPRRIETGSGIGETIQIRPDTDAYLLAAMLHEIDRTVGFAEGGPHLRNVEGLREFVRQYPPERVADVVGIDSSTITKLALDFANAPSAAAHMSTGVNMGRQGALAYWLVQMLLVVTDNLDQPGGNWVPARGTQPMGALGSLDSSSFRDSKWGPYRPSRTMIPGSLLADMIHDDDQPIRALVVASGNPALSIAGGGRLQEALASLDLLVCIDLYRNVTGELADVVLPAAAQFERQDFNFFVQGVQRTPWVQWTDRVVDPGDRREEWWILAKVAQAMGVPSLLDGGDEGSSPDVIATFFDHGLSCHGLSIAELRERERGVAVLPPNEPGQLFTEQIMTPDRTLDCCPEVLETSRSRCNAIFSELEEEPGDLLKLINNRTPNTLNSAFQNVAALKERGADVNPLQMHPDDLARLGLVDGDVVEVSSESGAICAVVAADPTLRPGVVAMTHGFGNETARGMTNALRHPGVNVNELAPSGVGSFDPVSGMAHLTGIAVRVTAAAPAS